MNVRSSAPNLPARSSLPPATAALPKDGIGSRLWALLFGLGGAVLVRVAMAGSAGVSSVSAGLVFGALVLGLAVLPVLAGARGGLAPGPVRAQLAMGLAGAAVLCAVPLAVHLRTPGGALPLSQLPVWAAVVTLVAVAEEVLLRGVLWTAAEKWRGTVAALVMTTGAFGLLHVPLYGWEALPLDLAVGAAPGRPANGCRWLGLRRRRPHGRRSRRLVVALTPTPGPATAASRPATLRRRARPAALVLVLATLALAGTVLARPPHAPPLYDGLGFPDEPYRWVVPPRGEQPTRLPATEASMRVPVTSGGNVESRAQSDEKGPQILLTAFAGAFAVPAAASSSTVHAVPHAVPNIQPDHGHVVSNLYVITVEAEGRPVRLARDYALLLNLRAVRSTPQAVVVCRWTGNGWQQVATDRVGVDIYAAWLDTIGPVALVQLDPGVSPQPAPLQPSSAARAAGPGADALWLALGAIVLVIAGSLLVVRRQG